MRNSRLYLFTAAGLLLWIILSWLTGGWLKLTGAELWILRGALIALGVAGAAGFLWLYRKDHGAPQPSRDELDPFFQEANARLQKSASGALGKIAQLPCLLILGDNGAAKTTTVVHSGLDPELLSGQVYRDRDIIPTTGLNIWFSRNNVLVEPGAWLLQDPSSRARLIRRLTPSRLGALFGKGVQAPRAALMCVECESFLRPGGAEATAAKARQLNALLGDLSQRFGIRLPVYILFTKMDRVAHFHDFVANLTVEEAAQVFGATLDIPSGPDRGAYNETQAARLAREFDSLFRSLSDWRPEILWREHDAAKLAAEYEFPREFRKLRTLMIQFLVDVCRPSQLQASPFLRGFYFAGVRPYVVHDIAAEPRVAPAMQPADLGATTVFNPAALAARAAAPIAPSPSGRRVPQWVFLTQLFSNVILRDQAARRSSESSVQVSLGRRALLAAATVLALVFGTGWTVSWLANRSLAKEVLAAAEALPIVEGNQDGAPPLASLQRLDDQRRVLERLTAWKRNGAPMHMRWGLYAGDRLYPVARRAYFETFRRLLLRTTQASLLRTMTQAPQDGSQGYDPVYEALKAYLITTSHPDKSTETFLAPVLSSHWQRSRIVDAERMAVAERQFGFYARELPLENPFPGVTPEEVPVRTARAYLSRFAAAEAIYAAMLSSVNQVQPPFVFNQAYPDSARTVVNTHPVPGAFTIAGWGLMKDAIDHPEKYREGEEWVLGQQSRGTIDVVQLQQQLRERYRAEFIDHWRQFLHQTNVVGFAGIKDSAAKLSLLTGNRSPLLLALCAVARNTAVEDKAIADRFQAPRMVEGAGCEQQLIGSGSDKYNSGLIQLQASLQQLGESLANVALQEDARTKVTLAQVTVGELSSKFPADLEGQVDSKTTSLLEDPIKKVRAQLEGARSEPVNSGVRGFCAEYRTFVQKYPFNKDSSQQATLQDVDRIFKPGEGALWRLYATNLSEVLTKSGSQYVANPSSGLTVQPAFLTFFNRMAAVSEAFYPGGSAQPNLNFRLGPVPSPSVRDVTLTINGKTAEFKGGRGDPQPFSWPGTGSQNTLLRVVFSGGSDFQLANEPGLWGVFRMFLRAERWQTSGNQHTMEWTLRTGLDAARTSEGQPVTVRLVLDMGGAPPIFQAGYLASLSCPNAAVR